MKTTKPTCPKCDAKMRLAPRTTSVPVAGVKFRVTWKVWSCPHDDTFVVPKAAHQHFDREVLQTFATKGPATGKTLKYMRGALAMKAQDLALLVGVKPETLSRWENEAQPVNPLVWVTVARMALDLLEGRTTTTQQLRAAVAGEDPPATISLEA